MMNPVFKRDSRVAARRLRLPLILVVFNSILALVALLNMYSTLTQVRLTATIQYSSFLDLYVFVAILEFVMLILIMPAITAGSISGERERQTLDLMLTTRMTAAQVVLGKLASAISMILLLIFSSFPILAMVFVYGGITLRDIMVMMLDFITIGFYVGSIGLFCSACSRKTTTATVATYVTEAALIGGTFAINYYVGNAAGGPVYLLLLNPALTFFHKIHGRVGAEPVGETLFGWFNTGSGSLITDHWLLASFAVQWLAALLLIILAVYRTDPRTALRKKH